MKKVVRLTESDLVRIVKRTINETHKEDGGNFYSDLNSLLDEKHSDLDLSDKIKIMKNITKNLESQEYRKKRNIGPVTKDEVLKNFKKFK